MVLTVLCFGVELLCCLNPMHDVCFHILVKFWTEWFHIAKVAAHLAYDSFSHFTYLIQCNMLI